MTDAFLAPSGIEKTTALLLSLGVDLSSKVLQYLGEGEIEQVLLALSKGSNISQETRREVMIEAYEMSQGGIGYEWWWRGI